ncbi:MAG TPA: hypothetical protein VIU38_07695 [Anaerolineales bacterium]
MDNPLSRARAGTKRLGGLLAPLKAITGLLGWLAALVQLTDEQQEQAGIYLGDRYHR